MKLRRVVGAATGLVILLVAVVIAYLLLSLDSLVERSIEIEGTRVMGTGVWVEGLDLELTEGKGSISELRVDNPEGFSEESALRLEDVRLQIDPSSVGGQPLRIQQVRVGESRVWLEIGEQGRSNLEEITRHIANLPAKPASGAEDGEEQRYTIERLSFAGGSILVQREGKDDPERVELPPLELLDLGGAEGVSGAELGGEITRAFTQRVVRATAGHELGRVVEKEVGGSVGEAAGELIRGIFR